MAGDEVKVHFPIQRGLLRRTVGHVKAVDGVDLRVHRGQTVGVVGESGSGKTTLGLALLRLLRSEGAIRFRDQDIQGWSSQRLRPLRRDMQIVFQDPFGSLSPRMSVAQIIEEGLRVHGLGGDRHGRRRLVARCSRRSASTEQPGPLSPRVLRRPAPAISIARAMVLEPSFVVLDEPTSALDMSVQAQIVDLCATSRRGAASPTCSSATTAGRARAQRPGDRDARRRGGRAGRGERIFERRAPLHRALIAAAFDIAAVETELVAT